MRKTYFDKHGEEILAGMTIRHDNGETELVYATTSMDGDERLGICATNPAYAALHPDCDIEYYPLSNFNLREWEIVK